MSSHDTPRGVRICKKMTAQERVTDREWLSGRQHKRESLEYLVNRYREIGHAIEQEMTSRWPSASTIEAKYRKRAEVAGILARQGITVQDEMNPKIVAAYLASHPGVQIATTPEKQK